MPRHTWNDQARRNSLHRRRSRAAGGLLYGTCVLRRVEAVGGGVGRACRVLDAVRPKMVKRRGEWVSAKWQRAEVLRLAKKAGVDLSQGRQFIPGQGGFRQVCYQCFADLASSPWCECLPKPAGVGAMAWYQEDGLILPPERRKPGGGQQRLKKWRESLRGNKPVVSARSRDI